MSNTQKVSANKAKEWNTFGHMWQKRKGSPLVPSPQALKLHALNFRRAFGKRRGLHWLVLGATPELRDLGLKLGCEVTFVDANLDMILKMNQLVAVQNRTREIMIKGNWLSVPLAHNYYHFVVSDVSLNNLDYKGMQKMVRVLHDLLLQEGHISLKEVMLSDGFECNTFKENLSRYRRGNFALNDFYLRARFNTFWKQCYEKSTKRFAPGPVFDNFKCFYAEGVLSKKEFYDLYQFYNLISHTILQKSELEKLLGRYFTIRGVSQTDSDTHDFYPMKIFFGKVKK